MIDSPDIWLTLSEASNITGKSAESLRKMIKRGKLLRVKKISGERGKQWVIHQDEIEQLNRQHRTNVQCGQKEWTRTGQIDFISVEHYDKQREKWEEEKTRLLQGLLMYRFKFEEIEKKIKLLPVPPDIIINEFDKVKKELEYKEKKLNETNSKLFNVSQALEQLELLLKDTQKCHKNVQSERNLLSSDVERVKIFQKKLQEEKNKLEEELQSVQMKVQMSQEQTRKLSNKVDELTIIKTQSEEKILLFEQERAIIEEKLKKKEEEYRTLQKNLENKNRVWWKKLFGIK